MNINQQCRGLPTSSVASATKSSQTEKKQYKSEVTTNKMINGGIIMVSESIHPFKYQVGRLLLNWELNKQLDPAYCL